jgi:YidC/Oxa1 family membrane protein insertase
MTENTKNMLIAAALSLIFIGLWDYFYAFPELDRQKQAQTQQARLAKTPKLGAPDQRAAAAPPAPVARTRDEALALSPRVAIDTRSISGSIALKGARLDDVSLKHYRQTVDPTSPIITLLSPEFGPAPYYAEMGFVTGEVENAPVLPTTETLWTAD